MLACGVGAVYTNHMTQFDTRRIENNTASIIYLPPYVEITDSLDTTIDFPRGLPLLPGLNTVPLKYLEALEALERPLCDKYGKPVGKKVRFPGREVLKQLQEPVVIYRPEGGSLLQPRITIHLDPLAGRDDGPPPPAVLPTTNEKVALALVAATSNTAVLRTWSKQPRMPEAVRTAILGKIDAAVAASKAKPAKGEDQ